MADLFIDFVPRWARDQSQDLSDTESTPNTGVEPPMEKEMSADQLHPEHVAAVAEKAHPGQGEAVKDAVNAGIPWMTILTQLFTMAAPVFIKWVQDWIAQHNTPAPPTPNVNP